jgi:DNA-binding response OmpR family regulator
MATTILIVDDDPGIRDLLSFKLEKSGFNTETLSSGEDCLDHLDEGPSPDLMLLDVQMPRTDGLEVLDRMQAEPDTDFPVLLLTRVDLSSGSDDVAGATDYIRKPFRITEVVDAVEAALDEYAGTTS